MRDHRHSDALTLLNRAIEDEVGLTTRNGPAHHADHRFYVNRGDCFMALSKTTLAAADFHTAYTVAPGDWAVTSRLSILHYNIATVLFNNGDFAGAEVELSAAIKQNPKVARYFACRGQTAYYQHKFDAACLDFRAALRLDSTFQPVLMCFKHLYIYYINLGSTKYVSVSNNFSL